MKHVLQILFCAGLSCGCMMEQEYPDAVPQNSEPQKCIQVSMSDGSDVPSGKTLTGWVPVGKGKSYMYESVLEENPLTFGYSGEGEAPVQVAYTLYADNVADSLYRGSLYLSIKPDQTVTEGDWDYSAVSYAGHLSEGKTSLYPLTGKIGFTVNQDDVSLCRISTRQDNALAGHVRVEMSSRPKVLPHEKSSRYVEVAGELEKGGTYYAVVAAEDYSILDVEFVRSQGL